MIVRRAPRPKPLPKDQMFEGLISLEKLPLVRCVRWQDFATSTRPGMQHRAAILQSVDCGILLSPGWLSNGIPQTKLAVSGGI
jgi:hypothetical protein